MTLDPIANVIGRLNGLGQNSRYRPWTAVIQEQPGAGYQARSCRPAGSSCAAI